MPEMYEPFDSLPINVLETSGPIQRKPVSLRFSRVKVWQAGRCINESLDSGMLHGTIAGRNLILNHNEHVVANAFFFNYSEFIEVSTTHDRLLWSVDLRGVKFVRELRRPMTLSAHYQNNDIVVIKINVDIPTPTLLEFIK